VAGIEVEAYREDVDNLTEALLAVVVAHTESLPRVDRDIIVAVAVANVTCRIDTIGIDRKTGGVILNPAGATGRLQRVTGAWKNG